jgi:hypothetical protein
MISWCFGQRIGDQSKLDKLGDQIMRREELDEADIIAVAWKVFVFEIGSSSE